MNLTSTNNLLKSVPSLKATDILTSCTVQPEFLMMHKHILALSELLEKMKSFGNTFLSNQSDLCYAPFSFIKYTYGWNQKCKVKHQLKPTKKNYVNQEQPWSWFILVDLGWYIRWTWLTLVDLSWSWLWCKHLSIFTESAHWANSVIELPCPFVCLSVCAIGCIFF